MSTLYNNCLCLGDAFEVAVLDANEKISLVDTANRLTLCLTVRPRQSKGRMGEEVIFGIPVRSPKGRGLRQHAGEDVN